MNTSGACPYCGYDGASAAGKYPLALKPSSILNGRYILGHVLGQGGFGITYLAWDDNMKERVAIKEYLPSEFAVRYPGSPSVQVHSANQTENFAYGKAQFLEEAKTLAAFIGDSHIVRIYSYFEENGTAYYCMEYVDGLPLDKYMATRGGRLTPAETNRLLLPLMESLERVHAKGIVHRDIAPDNILVTGDGTTKLIDFGAARYSTGEKSKSLDVILKHGFAPFEQYSRRERQGPWTDVYALGATWYYAVTGRVPPDSVDRVEEDELVPPSALGVEIDAASEQALLKALAVTAPKRFQSMGDFRRALLGTTGAESTAAAPVGKTTFVPEAPAAPAPAATAKKKSKLPLILGAVAVLAAVIFSVTRLTGGDSAAVKATPVPVETEDPAVATAKQAEGSDGLLPAMNAAPVAEKPGVGKYIIQYLELTPAYMEAMYEEYGITVKEGVESRKLTPEDMEGWYVELKDDGTGYLYWGENNQGKIDEWELNVETLAFKAGVSDVVGSIKDGLMRIEIAEGYDIYFAAEGAKLLEVELISMEDYIDLLYQ
ncbi:MAG: serine/threonine protein kinase [Oscillospiraceae bacterium]|nr:serine/threonine protein kinase [Oscillospiraceae bacterium]